MLRTFSPLSLGLALLASAGLLSANSVQAQNAASPPMGPRNVAANLDNPSGIAVHESGQIFVAAKNGVIRLFKQEDPEKRGMARKLEIGKYPTDIYGKGPMYDIGPLGLAFLDANHLIVGDGSRPDGQELVRIYQVAATAPMRPNPESQAAFTLGPIKPGEASAMGEGNFYGVAVTAGSIFITANGDDTKGWILRSEVKDGKPGELKPFIATKELLNVDAPCGITVNSKGDLVVGQMGEITVPGDSLLTIYDPKTGELKAKYETGLNDITGLAYSPRTGRLYVTDFSWIDPAQGGLFELTISGDKCTARKVLSLDKPTAIVFEPSGAALVTVFGTAEEGAKQKPGKLLRVNPRLLQ